MSATHKSGFTIIETMLFLAVTGVLVVGILVGTGTSINIQRYRDSVSTLKSVFQQQYSEVASVRNGERTAILSCDSSAQIGNAGTLSRGQADCVVLGRYITINGTDISTSTVIGHATSSGPYSTDVDELKAYNLAILPTSTETSKLEWGAQIAWPASGDEFQSSTTPRTIGLLILRSSMSGLVYTFSSDSSDSSASELRAMILPGISGPGITGVYKGQSQRRICVASSGSGFGGDLAIVVSPYASSASSIQSRSNDMGDSSKC